ncbi:dTDP-glucose 4,6-dehydratase [Candidatus Nitrosopelagicus sp.]|nr:dTDP-glucose 4,6-dehydratase [Candidatus Nitrosopelagicus sp.]
MKLLVTGGLGFIGSNFILQVLKNSSDFSVTNIDAELTGSDHHNLDELKNSPNYKFVKGNITNKIMMEKLIENHDCIINFAAESFVDRSILDANQFLVSNIRGTYTILEVLRKHKKRLIQISTDEVFGSLKEGSAHETSRFNPSNPYAATKASAELLVNSYVNTYDLDCVITRCTNNYGPRQFYEKLIPKTIFLANQNKKIPIYGKGENIRDWIYVNDHCEAVLRVLLDGKKGESYNVSSDNEIDNLSIVKKILELLGKSSDLIEFVTDRPGHDLRYSLNSSKIKNSLKWNPKISFDDGIQNTIDWLINNSGGKDISENILGSTPWKKS